MRRINVVVASGILLLCLIVAFMPLSVYACETTKTTTLLSSALITLGDSVTDQATVSPSNARGTVRFEVSTNGGYSWTQYGTVKTLPGGSPNTVTGDPYTPTAPGTYYFRAVYTPASSQWANSKSARYEEPLLVKLSQTVPEVPIGTLMAGAAMILALSCTMAVKRRKKA